MKSIITASHLNVPGMPSFTWKKEKEEGGKKKKGKKIADGEF